MNRKHFKVYAIQMGSLLILAGFFLFLCPLSGISFSIHCPLLTYGEEKRQEEISLFCQSVMTQIPLYGYAGQGTKTDTLYQSTLSEEEIYLLEARDEENEDARQQALMEAVEQENVQMRGEDTKEQEQSQKEEIESSKVEENSLEEQELSSQPVVSLNMDSYQDFDKLLKDFYMVDKTTCIDSTELDINKLLSKDLTLTEGVEGPQILIYHTHSQEAYADSVPGDESMTVVGAGEKLAKILSEQYGLQVMHHKGQYDVEGRDYAYANVTPVLEQILEENPSIEVVIDLHRDGVADGTHLVTEINGKKTAQFMFFNGLSRLKNVGEIAYLQNDNREGNLAFSFQMQVKCQEYYPGLARKIYLKGYRYNLQYKEKSMLVELGAQTNTVEEVNNALAPLAHVIAMVLKGE